VLSDGWPVLNCLLSSERLLCCCCCCCLSEEESCSSPLQEEVMSEIFASCKDEFEKPQNQTWQKLETLKPPKQKKHD
jgi:hypothetical protein